MKYFLLCALVIAGAFFSPVYASQDRCPDGGTFNVIDGIEMCTVPAPLSTLFFYKYDGHDAPKGRDEQTACDYVAPIVRQAVEYDINRAVSGTHSTSVNTSTYMGNNICRITFTTQSTRLDGSTYSSNSQRDVTNINQIQDYYCPPDGKPPGKFTNFYPVEPSGGNCWHAASPPPQCDCANFAGDSLKTNNDLLAPEGQYTEENPPQCVRQSEIAAGRDTPLECVCQVSAQKWAWSYAGFNPVTNTQMVRWQTRPTQIGQPSGTFTGVKCGSEDGGPLEPENDAPKDCFTLKNGVKWCWADKAEKCQVVNGVEQCASGCGTVNGDFVCYEDTPVIPPKDRDQLTPPDDTLTDPGKSINDMVKGDFKEINKGVESRLDNVVTSITNSTIAMDEVSDKVGLTNSKLDGIGMQLDGIGKQLGDIDGTLEGAFGDDGEPQPGTGDGETCYEDICSWYESAYPDGLVGIWQERSADLQQTPLFNFLNQLGTVQPTGGQPDFNICFNLGAMGDYGCKSFEIPSAVWAFIRLMILICAGIFCYRIISGV